MKIKVISRNPDEYLRETKRDIHKGEYIEEIFGDSVGNPSWGLLK